MKVHVVLVRTEYSSNLGAAARAMANMGADRLILVDPRCALNSKAKQMAAGAQEKLSSAIRYASWTEFYAQEGQGTRIAMTRRAGKQRLVLALEECLQALSQAEVVTTGESEDLYLIFGPEADGLDIEDMAYVNFACHLPVFGDFASLNLAQAVLLSLFITRGKFPVLAPVEQLKGGAREVVQPFYFPDALVKDWLTAIGFNIQARRSSAYLTLRKLLLQNLPTRHEIQVLEAVLQQNVRKLRSIPPCDETTD